jgi:tRNA(Phe) wybutosine-synthesizing methylase Tyw3
MGALAQDIVARNRDWQTGKLTTKGQLEVQNLYAEDAIKRSNAALGHAKEKMRKMSPEEFKREADIMELMRPRRLY